MAGEHPVYERHLSALTESAPSMTIRVVECSPAAGLGSRSCDCVCLMNDLMTLIRELMIQFACLPPRATFPRCFSLLSVTSSQLSFSKQLQRNISILFSQSLISSPYHYTQHLYKCLLPTNPVFLPVKSHHTASVLPLPHTSTNYICKDLPLGLFFSLCLCLAV